MAIDIITSFSSPITGQTPEFTALKTDRAQGRATFRYGYYKFGNGGAYPHAEDVVSFASKPIGMVNPITSLKPFYPADVMVYEDQTLLVMKLTPEDLLEEKKYMVSELSVFVTIISINIDPYMYFVGENVEVINVRYVAEYFDPQITSSNCIKIMPIIGG